MIFAVIDTNVIVAAMMTRHDDSATLKVLRSIEDGLVTPLCSPEIVAEYREVLSREKFQFNPVEAHEVIEGIVGNSVFLDKKESGLTFIDGKDRVFYEVALAGPEGNTRLVTGNLRHYPATPIVVTPAQFCEILGLSPKEHADEQ